MSNALATQQATVPNSASAGALLMDMAAMDRLERLADLMASGKTTVPQHLRGSKGDCFAISLQSMQWGMNPFAVAQKTHLVNGTLGYEAQLVAAVINSSGVVSDRFNFEWFGEWEKIVGKFKQIESKTKKDDSGFPKKFIVPDWDTKDEQGLGIKIWATLKGEAKPRELILLMTQARTRNSTLWTEDPKQQLAYLAQKRWARLHTPDVILGVYTPDELAPPTEVHMGPVDEVSSSRQPEHPTTPPPYDQAKFDHNVQKWAKTVVDGQKTAPDVLAWLRSKATVSTEQEAQLLAEIKRLSPLDVQAKVVTPAPAAASTDTPVVDPEKLAADLQACTNLDKVYELGGLIDAITDEAQRLRVTEIFDARVAQLEQA